MSLGFTRITKASTSTFAREPWCRGVSNSSPFLSWDISINPWTHISFYKPFLCTIACACSLILNCAPEMRRKPSSCIKMSKRNLNNSNFFNDTPIVASSLEIQVLAIQTQSFAVVTPLCNSNQDKKPSWSHTIYYHQPCDMQHKLSWSTVGV